MLSNFSKWYTDHSVRGQNWIFLKSDIWTDCISVRGRVKERAIHKSFLDIAASLPQTHFLPASLCLSSKLHNPCQSCLDCRLNVIHKQGGEKERGWRGDGGDGEDYNLLSMELCSIHSYDNYLLLAFTGSIPFFIGAGSVQMELACNYNAPKYREWSPLWAHCRADHWIFEAAIGAPVFTRNVSLMDLSQGQIWKLWLKTECCYGSNVGRAKAKQSAAERSTVLFSITVT